MKHNQEGRPVFECDIIRATEADLRRGDGDLLAFFCPYCKRRHTHGPGELRAVPGKDYGHRVAHCHSEGGRKALARGYFIVAKAEKRR